MISSRPNFYFLKLILEAQSAHAIHTGHGDTTHDSLIVRDANGLPTLSGSSLAGVLRHQYQQRYGEVSANNLFGYAQGEKGQNSWLNISWGLVHNSKNQAYEGLISQATIDQDQILSFLKDQKPIVRQRVRLTDLGCAEEAGKFDVTLVPAGTRYTTFLSYWCDGSDESILHWKHLVELLNSDSIRVGQGTRSGYGLFKIIQMFQAQWNLTTVEGRQGYCQRRRSRTDHFGLSEVILPPQSLGNVTASLKLKAEAGWRIGGGEKYLENNKNDRIPDLLPMHETKIIWKSNQASLINQDQYLLPATAIKGAIRHRIAYHYNCLNGLFTEDASCLSTEQNPAVVKLLGYTQGQQAQAGLLSFKDIYLTEQQVQTMTHNKIDRYTGGVIRGALFSEVVLWQSEINVEINVLQPKVEIEPTIKQALALTLEDLAQGWLSLGASGSRGLGIFTDHTGCGTQWSDQQQWLNAGVTQ